jgi:hypothetical protein
MLSREEGGDERGETDREIGVQHDVEGVGGGMLGGGGGGGEGGGHVVAFVGHRWHLGPALCEAHVGISLGAPGAQVYIYTHTHCVCVCLCVCVCTHVGVSLGAPGAEV